MIERLTHCPGNAGLIGDIGIDSDSIALRLTGGMAIDDDHPRSSLRKSRRDRLTQPSSPSGDDYDFSVHSHRRSPGGSSNYVRVTDASHALALPS
jgi:hypothetical protein